MSESTLAGAGDLRLPAAACRVLGHDLPRAGSPEAALALIDGVRQSLLGPGLLTVNLNATAWAGQAGDADTIELQRIWTSNPAAYPVAGRKRKALTPWTRQLLVRAELFVGEGDEVLAGIFDDHALIASLGLRAVVNVPLLDEVGGCFATFNLLGTRPQWQPEELLLVQLLGMLATPAVRRLALAA